MVLSVIPEPSGWWRKSCPTTTGNGTRSIASLAKSHKLQLVPFQPFVHLFQASDSSTTFCEESSLAIPNARNQKGGQGDDEKVCSVCMYTGMAVCTGLSLYFVKLATDETVTLAKNRRFLWVSSAGWAVAGVYRWYLG